MGGNMFFTRTGSAGLMFRITAFILATVMVFLIPTARRLAARG